jgi:membrane associated rhomboid family serine protease
MFIPFSSEHADSKRLPIVNVAIVLLTVIASVCFFEDGRLADDPTVLRLILRRGAATPLSLLGHTLVHGDGWHLLGNMLALLAMGNAVNARLGHARYLALYVASAVAGGIGWLAFGDGHSAAGASGAVSGVVAAFLILFPLTRVNVLFWLPAFVLGLFGLACALLGIQGLLVLLLAGLLLVASTVYSVTSLAEQSPPEGALLRIMGFHSVAIPGVLLVLLTVGLDVVGAVLNLPGIAFEAHLAGSVVGLAAGLGLALTRSVVGTHADPTLPEWVGVQPRAARQRTTYAVGRALRA